MLKVLLGILLALIVALICYLRLGCEKPGPGGRKR